MNYRQMGIRILLASQLSSFTYGFDNAHFYRATNFFYETRVEKPWLTTIDIWAGTGSTRSALNDEGNKVPLLDVFGTQNLQELGVNVPCKNPADPLQLILMQLELTTGRDCFATFSINGRFEIKELNFFWIQNYDYGFFTELHFPIRQLEIDDIAFCDLSPQDCPCPNICTPIWRAFKDNFEDILQQFSLVASPFKETGIGDLSFYVGWTHNYQESELLDFVDITVRAGFLAPTGKEQDICNAFSLPLGYNGHWGFPVNGAFAFGTCEWLVIGLHLGALLFLDNTKCFRMKTAPHQSGPIKLATGLAKESRGTLWTAGSYVKADHFVRSLSLLIGYTFANQNSSELKPCDCEKFSPTLVNQDEMLQGWKMHTVHFMAELDFAKECARWTPRFTFFFNFNAGGKRIFKTSTVGGIFGFDIDWCF